MLSDWYLPQTIVLTRKEIAACCEMAKLKQNIHPRMLRHAGGYELGKKGIDDDSIQDYLGYRNLKSILRYNSYVEE